MENRETENMNTSMELTLKEQILLQVERLGVIESSLESARLNQGVTDRFVEWVEKELIKIAFGLEAAGHRAERLENKINLDLNLDPLPVGELIRNKKSITGG